MYKCSKCKKVFDYFEIENGVCPHCGETDIYKIGTCEECGKTEALEDFDYGRLFNGMCAECFQKSISDIIIDNYIGWCIKQPPIEKYRGYSIINTCEIVNYAYGLELDYATDDIAISALLAQLSELLHSEVRTSKMRIIIENARDWAFDDLDCFYEWYVKRENNETV